MEFEKDDTIITDDQRLRAAAKQVTIQPLNSSIHIEPAEVVVVNEVHPNVDRDTEDTGRADGLLQPSKSERSDTPDHDAGKNSPPLMLIFVVCTVVVAGLLAAYFMFSRS